jgi:uncharacterized membrane protein
MTFQRFVFFVLLLVAALQAAYYYPMMPLRMASHFDAAGRANSWMPKESFLVTYVLVVTLTSGIFTLLPKLIIMFPDSMINLPNKDYWLAAERREQTGETIERSMNTVGNLGIAFLLCVFQMAFRANLEKEPRLPESMWLLIALFLILLVVWGIRFIRGFRIPPDPA